MKSTSLVPLMVLATSVASAETRMVIGDGRIDGTRIKPYELEWFQCALQDDAWVDGGTLVEKLVVIGDHVLLVRQTVRQPGGMVRRSATYFDRKSFAPLRMEMEAMKDGSQAAYVERELGPDGYTSIAVRGGEQSALQGAASSNMLHGGAMGLPLAAMSFQDEPVRFLASMIAFDATYDIIAEWVGEDIIEFDGQEIVTWIIDVEWRHREIGDVYPPGPDASGGRYWVAPHPPAGFPYVPRYKTDTYAVEFVRQTCPGTRNER